MPAWVAAAGDMLTSSVAWEEQVTPQAHHLQLISFMAKPLKTIHFEATNKKLIKGKVGHTRTGACTAKGRCYHGPNKNAK